MVDDVKSVWTSLEVVKLVVGTLGPLALAFVGHQLSRGLQRLAQAQWATQKVIEKRIAVYGEVVPKLNQLLCFFLQVGAWKSITPPRAIELKRQADEAFHVNAPLFSWKLMERYFEFMNGCFRTGNGIARDARLRALAKNHELAAGSGWKAEWQALFDEHGATPQDDVKAAYEEVVTRFAEELGVGLSLEGIESASAEVTRKRASLGGKGSGDGQANGGAPALESVS